MYVWTLVRIGRFYRSPPLRPWKGGRRHLGVSPFIYITDLSVPVALAYTAPITLAVVTLINVNVTGFSYLSHSKNILANLKIKRRTYTEIIWYITIFFVIFLFNKHQYAFHTSSQCPWPGSFDNRLNGGQLLTHHIPK